ncbi:MAG: GTP 3',8-cyclase MoaA [Deltaproteobacteria bacterium]|nr:MAG: GTP 3',8-cyclase MoaA [Deltaproteobacteria bacterium]
MAHVHLPVLGSVAPGTPLGGAISGALPDDPLLDNFSRRIRYLRVSVTDRCNYRCSYCMPEELGDQLVFEPRSAVLSFEELERLIAVFARLGVRKIRLTGGEPTVRKGIVELAQRIAALPGIEQVVMTSNGHLLGELAAPLAAAGVSAINISIDTLDAGKFHALTGRGDLARVLAGVDAAVTAGMRVKLNAVALRGVNDGELVALCEYAWSRGAVPRFIEHMPMSDGALYAPAAELSAAAIRRTLEAALGALVPAEAPPGRDPGPARYWSVAATGREIGIISAMTEHFCDNCNRLRLTAIGALHACLGHDDAVSLRDVIRGGGSDDDVVRAIAAAVTGKRAGHVFDRSGAGAPQKHMIGIGG